MVVNRVRFSWFSFDNGIDITQQAIDIGHQTVKIGHESLNRVNQSFFIELMLFIHMTFNRSE